MVLGNERDGVSQEAVELADACAILPMAGYVESLNISVAAALIFYEAQQQRIRKLGACGDLSEHQRQVLKAVHVVRALVGGCSGRTWCLLAYSCPRCDAAAGMAAGVVTLQAFCPTWCCCSISVRPAAEAPGGNLALCAQ